MRRAAACAALFVAAGVAGGAAGVAAQQPEGERVVHIQRVSEPPRLEQFLNGQDGDNGGVGVRVTGLRQREPGDGTPVSQPTEVYLSYDDDHLYVIFKCKDEPGRTRANVARREDIENDDVVAVYLDTFQDRERAYLFMANPLGIQLDGIVTEGQDDDMSFDAVWDSEGRLTDDGYIVRISIPFRSLRFSRSPDQAWGIALARLIRRESEESYWPYITNRTEGFVPQFGTLRGLQNISAGRNIQLMPYGVLGRTRFLDEDAIAHRMQGEHRVGVDAKVILRDAFTVDVTANPDFSQVESDAPQVTANERFEVYFPEKRPFFLENAGYFQTPIELFFSRRIVDPGVGTRFTGKAGPWAIGAIAINDRTPGELDEDDPRFERNGGVGVFRVQREIGESTVGLLLTDRELAGSFDRSLGLDTRLKLGSNWVLTGMFAGTKNQLPDGARLEGTGMRSQLEYEGRNLEYSGEYLGFTPDFSAPLGFVSRTGFHQTEHELQYKWRPEKGAIVAFGPTLEMLYNWDRSGRMQDREIAASFQVELTRETEVELGRVQAFELFDGFGFRPHATELSVTSEWFRWLALEASYAWGTAVNHDPAEGMDPFLGDGTEAQVGLTLRPTPRLRLDNSYAISRLAWQGARVFDEHDFRTRLSYQFSRALSLRAILDYEAIVPDSTLTDEEHEREWFGDVLLTYLVNPGTALHIGYTDRYENLTIVPGPERGLLRRNRPALSVGRQLFAKVSYLLRF